MSPTLAFLLCSIFIMGLFLSDFKKESPVSRSVWIPLFWMMIIGTRPVSYWLDPFRAAYISAEQTIAASPVDRIVYLVIEIAGLFVLVKRKDRVIGIIKNNSLLFIFLFYCGISVVWSEFPAVTIRRWMKITIHFVIVLILLSESDPVESIKAMIRRYSYVAIPLSVVFIKYFPQIGRSYDPWTGIASNHGISYGKNSLGYICMTCGIFFFWNLLTTWKLKDNLFNKSKYILFLIMIIWLLYKADSSTSLGCLIIGVFFIVGLSISKNIVKYLKVYTILTILIFVTLYLTIDFVGFATSALNRDITLTGRTDIWKEVIKMTTNPFFGTGYECFWWGPRLEKMWEKYWWLPNQAHNGYIETYINLGLIGLFLLISLIISSYNKICKILIDNYEFGKLKMALFIAILLYNVTEAGFRGIHFMFFVFILVAANSLSNTNGKMYQ